AVFEVNGPQKSDYRDEVGSITGSHVCRACGGPRFKRNVCARCGANANDVRGMNSPTT
ncbi:unnamed protein product, partial [Choristocarpus tenellus]